MTNTDPLDDVFAAYPAVLTVAQVAELIGKTPGTTYKLLQAGDLPAYKIGGEWTIYRAELLAFLKEQRHGPEVPPQP